MLAGQQLQQPVLGVVRVLVLVDQHVAERLAPALERLGEALEHLDGQHQQVVEVDRVAGVQPALVQLVGLGDGLVVERLRRGAMYSAGPISWFFAFEICAWMPRGTKRFGSRSSASRHCLTSADLVGLVVDREVRAVAEPRRLAAQDPAAGGVEGEDPDRAGDAAEQRPRAARASRPPPCS